ncbi:hypothetical protein EN871_18050 [bacterium M00.F.Ca.ET.228.01.1.1]|nr:hypothetical protein EN871_18050 [bacterium M00.F.Ca.ET.228.01.1.1]TGR99023.1 hypothetical protein EN834_20690 [bacterium M00.F.Ca.ET.191.01.1.1]TGU03336.1 hypothetical protein EN798_21510 [bacterium M00.F.Ca.ET.155.01.1.1]
MKILTRSQQTALRECAMYRPGDYVWKPVTMAGLCALGLAYQTEAGAFCLTQKGADVVRKLKNGSAT